MTNTMKKILIRFSKLIAPLSLALAIMTSNATCYFFTYQPNEPEKLRDLSGMNLKERGKSN